MLINLELSNQGKKLSGEFYTNDGEVLDHFTLHESKLNKMNQLFH